MLTPKASESEALWARGWHPGYSRWAGQIFTAGVRGGNLKTWKTENLTS